MSFASISLYSDHIINVVTQANVPTFNGGIQEKVSKQNAQATLTAYY